MTAKELMVLFRQTQFIADKHFKAPNQFAIVTACNPLNKVLSAPDNEKQQQALAADLTHWQYWSMTGCSPDLIYSEAGFAITCSLSQAIELAKKYQQNAIFWVTDDELWVYPAQLIEIVPERIGWFSERLLAKRS